jgi:hypothetical protein
MYDTAALTSLGTTSPRYKSAHATLYAHEIPNANLQTDPLTVLALTRVTLDHLIAGFETGESHVRNRVLLVVSLLRRYNRSKRRKGKVDTWEASSVLS